MDAPAETPYPQPQQHYRLNFTMLSWGELWRVLGPLRFFGILIGTTVRKAFRLPLLHNTRIPREISFRPPDPTTLARHGHLAEAPLAELQALGFEHSTTYTNPEVSLETATFALVNREEQAYSVVLLLVAPGDRPSLVVSFATALADGGVVDTSTSPRMKAYRWPPSWRVEVIEDAPLPEVWERHKQRVTEVAPEAGGIDWRDTGRYAETRRTRQRQLVDFMVDREVYWLSEPSEPG